MAPTRQLAALFYDLRARTTDLSKDLKGAETQFSKLTTFVKANPVAAIGALGVALAGIAIKATKMAAEVEASLRRVANAVPTGNLGLDKLRDALEDVSRATGRTQAELAQDAAQIARQGAESAEAVVQRLRAAQLAADATGTDIKTVIGGLDQTLDLFNASSAQAADALGTLFAAARGRTSLDDLFSGLQAAAPAVTRLKLDLDTAARAIVALVEQGKTTKQAAAELNKLAAAGAAGRAQIQRLADSMPAVGNGLADMSRAAVDFNNSTEQLTKRLQGEFSNALIELGQRLLPAVNFTLKSIVETLDILSGRTAEVAKSQGTSALATTVATAARASTEGLKKRTEEFVDAARELNKLVVTGQGDIVATTAEQAERIEAGLVRLIQAGAVTEAQVAPLLNFLDDLEKRTKTAPRPTPRAGGTGLDSNELKKQTDAAEKADAALESLARRIGDLGTVQEVASGQTRISAEQFRDLARDIEEVGRKFPGSESVLAAFTARLEELRVAAASFSGAELAREIEELLASFTTTIVDDLEIGLRRLQERLAKQGATEAQITQITELEQSFIAARAASEELDAALSAGRAGAITPLREMAQLLQKIADTEAEIADRKKAGTLDDRTRAELLDQIAKLQARIKELQDETEEATKKTTKTTADLTDGLSNALDVAFGLATALLGADDTLTKMIGSAAQVANGLSDIAKLAREAGGLGKLFSSGAGILSALPGIGSIIGGGAAIASIFLDDPDARANRDATQKNTAALRELERSLGDLARITLAGRVTAGVTSAVGAVGISGGFAGPLETLRDLQTELRRAGVTFEDFKQLAKDLGFDFSRFTVEGFLAFQKALRDLDFKAFTNTFAGALDALEQRFQLFEIDDSQDRFDALIDLLTDPKRGAPALFGALDGLDIKTAEGQAKAKKVIQEIFQGLVDGSIDPATLNGLNLDQLRDILTRIFGEIGDAVIDAAQTLADAFDEIDLDLAIAGDQSPLNRAIKRFAAAAETDERFADLLGFNLGTAEGRASAEQFLKSLSIGADEDFKRIILQLLEAIRDIPGPETETRPGEVEIVGRGAQGLLETTGQSLASFARTGLILDRERNALLTNIRDLIRPQFNAPLIQPPAFSRSLGASVTASSNVTFVVGEGAVAVTVQGITGATEQTGTAIGEVAARQLFRRFSQFAAEEARLAELVRGRVVVAG